MIRILIDPQTFINQEFGGISRYFTELCIKMANNSMLHLILPILYTDNIYYMESHFFPISYQNKHAFLIKYSRVFRRYAPRKLKKKSIEKTIDILNAQEFDLFVPTYYDPYFLAHLQGKPFVLTVHDMIHELYPYYFEDDPYTTANKKILIEKATRIIAVSDNTKKDILRIYPDVDEKKIDVVYLAHHFSEERLRAQNLPKHYILFVGNRTLYKNFTLFMHAVFSILSEKKDLYIVCAGGNPFNDDELLLLKDMGITDRVIQQNFKDAELKTYYQNALCFVFPSSYEGFGIPVLEAMASGCPVILTNNSSFPEIAGDAGIYFELDNQLDLQEKIRYLLNNDEVRAQHILKGIHQAGKFTWQKTMDETLLVYQKALNK